MANQANINTAIASIEQLLASRLLDAAESQCAQLWKTAPLAPRACELSGRIRLMQARWAEAETALRQAVALDKRYATGWINLAAALRGLGRSAEAEKCARRAVMLDSASFVHWAVLGGALLDQGRQDPARLEEAARALQQAATCNPQLAEIWSNLGMAEHLRGRLPDARSAYERALALAPNDLDLLMKYASVLVQQGEKDRGFALLHTVLTHAPQMAGAWSALGDAFRWIEDWDQAEAAYQHVLQLVPRYLEGRYNLGLTLYQRARYSEAERCFRELIAEAPGYADAWTLLAWIAHFRAEPDKAVECLQKSVQVRPDASKHSKLLLMMQYQDAATATRLLDEHRKWDAAYARPLLPRKPASVPKAALGRRLRLGFVSEDFGRHPIGFLALPALEKLDQARCSVVCYSDRAQEDEYTLRFRKAAELWRQTRSLTDAELAEQVRQDGIDILVDLAGHVGNRLLAFAGKPAALQVSWLGYVGTTGMTAMDFLLADRLHVANGEEPAYAETILRMPNGYACYGPPADAPAVNPLPAAAAGAITFGCFNNPAKYGPRILDAWAAILGRVKGSTLFLKYKGLDKAELQETFRSALAARGIEGQRVLFGGESPHREFLAAYQRVDIALDTQPYSGGLTTCEALWMGVPVITWPGQTFAGRHSVSHLTSAGYPQFIAADLEGYVDLAVPWALRLDELASIRAQMRDRVGASPLCDASRFAQDFLALLLDAWQSRAHA